MKTKTTIFFYIISAIFISCKKEAAEKPEHLIERDKMVNIIYDLSLLAAMKNQNPALLDSFKTNPNQYIYKKHKTDSTQFAQSNIYYAADYKEYKKMYEQVKLRLDENKSLTEATVKAEQKKKGSSDKLKSSTEKDSIKNTNSEPEKTLDSIKKRKHKRKSLLF